jgi:hypothetical protein
MLTGCAFVAGALALVASTGCLLRSLPRDVRTNIVRFWFAAKVETKFKIICAMSDIEPTASFYRAAS